MNNNNILTPALRFPGFSGDWSVKLVKDFCDINTGKSNTQDQVEDGKYPFYIRSAMPVRSNRYLYDCEAVITIGDGQIGKVFHYVNGKFDLHQRCYMMSNFKGINPRYFYYFFSGNFYERAMRLTAKATVDSVRLEMISDMPIFIPPTYEEQNAIASLLSELDHLISAQEQKVESLKAYKKGLMQQLFPQPGTTTPSLRFPGFEGEWEERKLGEIGDTFSGLTGKSKEDFENGNSKFITFMNVLKNVRIDTSILGTVNVGDNERQNKVENGDMLFNTSSETPEEVGFCAVYDSDIKENVYLNSFCFGYRFKDTTNYYPLFLAYYFRSSYGRDLMNRIAQGITRFNLSKEYFTKAIIPFPSFVEQQTIAECLSAWDYTIAAEQNKLDALIAHKKGLMQQLFPKISK